MTKLELKAAIAAPIALVGAYLQQLLFPLIVLVLMEVFDYISGMANAWKKKTLCSRVGIEGIVKKVLYFCIVLVGCVFDYLIYLLGNYMGIPGPNGNFIGLLVIIWLIINEGISILENLGEMGLPSVPKLDSLLDHLKKNVESSVTKGRHEQ